MTNHYKKLRSVKSVVDTSSPAGYERQSRPPSRSEYRRESCQNNGFPLKIRRDKFQNSWNSSANKNYDTPRTHFVRSASVPARPQTRRRLVDMPTAQVCPQRAQSSGPFVKEDSNIPNLKLSRSNRSSRFNSPANSSTPRSSNQPGSNSSHIKINNHKTVSKESEPPIPAPRKTKRRRNAFKNWIVEHDYMEFMLRITEDIIQNNLYTGEEILQVLNNHIEANMERLSVPKMMQQIRILCRELNVPFDKILISHSNVKVEFMEPLESTEKSLICTCNSANNNKHDFGDCECTTKRSSPFQCAIHSGKSEIDNLLKINQDFSLSQNIVQAYYFKNVNDSANSEQTTNINNNGSNDEESTNAILIPHSLSCVPELNEASESSEMTTTIRTNEPQASQPQAAHKCCTSPKTAIKHKHPCNCSKSKQLHLHTHTKIHKSLNGDESVQSQNIKSKIENSVRNLSNPETANLFCIGCQCANPTEPSPILPGPLDAVRCCINAQQALYMQHVDYKHQVHRMSKSGINEPFAFKTMDKMKKNQNENSTVQDNITDYHSPVTQKNHFYNRNEDSLDPDEEFVLSLGTAYMPKSVSKTSNVSLFENICIVAPDASDKCKLILLQNIPKQYDSTPTTEINAPSEVSDLNSSYIVEAPQVNTKDIPCKNNVSISTADNEKNFADKYCAQISSVGTMTTSKCSSKVVCDKNKNLTPKTSSKTTKGSTMSDKAPKNIYLIVPDDVKHDQIFVVRKSQFEKLDTQSGKSLESEFQIIKDIQDLSTASSMYSCMATMQNAASCQSSAISNPAFKIKKTSNLKNTVGPQFVGESTQQTNMAASPSCTNNRPTLKTCQPNNSCTSRNTFLSTNDPDFFETYDIDIMNSKVLLKLNDYDLTPQRDNNSNNPDAGHKRISFTENNKSFMETFETNKDKLLLGNKYEINQVSSSTDYSKGIPDSIKQFYPNTASQTGPSDYSSATKSMSEPSISKNNNLEPPTNSHHSTDNQEKVQTSSSLSSMHSKYQKEEQDQTDNESDEKQIKNVPLDLMLDIEVNSEEQNQKKIPLPAETDIISDSLNNQGESQFSSSASVLNELLVSAKYNEQLNDARSTSPRSTKIEKLKNENIDTKSENILQSVLKKSKEKDPSEKLEFTDSQLVLFFKNDIKTIGSTKNSFGENEYQTQLNRLNEKSKTNSDIINSMNKQSEIVQELPQNIEATPQSARESKNLVDDHNFADENDDNYNDDSAIIPKQAKVTSLISNSNANVPQSTGVYEKPSLKTVENKNSTSNSQRRVLIKEHIVDRKESFAPRASHHDAVPIELPFIQIDASDPKLSNNNKRTSSSDSTQTWCCGLKSGKRKARRDIIDADKGLQTIPNVSTIPDDQLFEVEMRRPTQAGYGAERKSLRFDYSMMSELSDVEGVKLVDTNLPTGSKVENISEDETKLIKSEQFTPNETITKSSKTENKTENSSLVIDIYTPARHNSTESFMLDGTSLKEKISTNPDINNLKD